MDLTKVLLSPFDGEAKNGGGQLSKTQAGNVSLPSDMAQSMVVTPPTAKGYVNMSLGGSDVAARYETLAIRVA